MHLVFSLLTLSALAQAQSSHIGAGPEGALWGDFDHDGLSDVYSSAPGRDDVLLRNLGDGTFADVTLECGLAGLRSRVVRPGDFDRDQLDDLLVVSEAGELMLFRGLVGGAFERASTVRVSLAGAASAAWVDYDQDGWLDVQATTALGEPVFFHNQEGLAFEEIDLGLAVAPAVLVGASSVDQPVDQPADTGRAPADTASGKGAKTGAIETRKLVRPVDVSFVPGPLEATGGVENVLIDLVCAQALRDFSTGDCLRAASNPTLGMLYPISQSWFIEPGTGNVGLGTTTPATRLDVDGEIRGAGTLSLHGSTPQGTVARLTATDAAGGTLDLRDSDVELGIIAGGSRSDTGAPFLDMYNEEEVLTVALRSTEAFRGGALTLSNPAGANGRLYGNGFTWSNDQGVEALRMYASSGGLISINQADGNPAVLLGNSGGGVSMVLHDQNGQPTVGMGGGDAFTRSYLAMLGASGVSVRLHAGTMPEPGGNLHLSSDSFWAPETLALSGHGANAGAEVTLRNDSAEDTLELTGDDGNDSGLLVLRDRSLTNDLVGIELRARNELSGSGGVLRMSNADGEPTAVLVSNDGNDSGRLLLRNGEGANNFVAASLRAQVGSGRGAELRLRDENNNLVFDLDTTTDSVGTNTPELALFEADGSLAWRLRNDVFEGRNNAGVVTISYNRVTGAKNAVVTTESFGQRTLYCEESTEVWFSDYGSGQLDGGEARIVLDPVFLETVLVDEENPLKVFLTPTAPIGDYWVEKGARGFVVHAEDGGQGSFDWRVVAKRRGLPDARLEAYAPERSSGL